MDVKSGKEQTGDVLSGNPLHCVYMQNRKAKCM